MPKTIVSCKNCEAYWVKETDLIDGRCPIDNGEVKEVTEQRAKEFINYVEWTPEDEIKFKYMNVKISR